VQDSAPFVNIESIEVIELICRRGDSNPHELPHTPLKRARLPVPPLRHRLSDNSRMQTFRLPCANRIQLAQIILSRAAYFCDAAGEAAGEAGSAAAGELTGEATGATVAAGDAAGAGVGVSCGSVV
jgi:hypothetical protein